MDNPYRILGKALLGSYMLCSTFLVHAQTIRVSGSVAGKPDGTKVYLYADSSMRKALDSSILTAGRFDYLAVPSGSIYKVRVAKSYQDALFITEGVPVEISIDGKAMTVKGGPLQQRLEEYEQLSLRHQAEWQRVNPLLEAAGDDLKKKEALLPVTNKIFIQQLEDNLQQVKANAGNLLGGYIAGRNAYAWRLEDLDTLIPWLKTGHTPAYYLDPLLRKQAELKATVITGLPAADFTLKTPAGKQINLFRELAQHKYVLIDFWASWCGPCRAGNKELKPVYDRFRKKGFEIISISFDTDPAKWKKALQEDGIPWKQVILPENFKSELAAYYKVSSLPTTFLIDNTQQVIDQKMTHEQLETFLEASLK